VIDHVGGGLRHAPGGPPQALAVSNARNSSATYQIRSHVPRVVNDGGNGMPMAYERLGWERVGVIPGYALLPRGGLCSTTVYYRNLG
jgi:hypothetical protein